MLQATAMLAAHFGRTTVAGAALLVAIWVHCCPPAAAQPAPGAEPALFLPQTQADTFAWRRKYKACRTSTFSHASEVDCFRIDAKTLEEELATDDPNAGSLVHLLPKQFGTVSVFARKSFSNRVKNSTSDFEWLGSVYSGSRPSVKIGTATFLIERGTVTGRFSTAKEIYEIRPVDKALHVIIRLDPRKLPPLHPKLSHPPLPSPPYEPVPQAHTVDCTSAVPPDDPGLPEIAISVVFEDGALATSTPDAEGKFYVSMTNTAMRNSLAQVRAVRSGTTFVHTLPPFVVDYRTLQHIIAGSASSPGSIGQIHQWRAQDKADIVVIVTQALGACGYSIMTNPPDPAYGFVLINPVCTSTLQVTHEIGHLLGADHEPGSLTIVPESETYGRAYLLPIAGKRTIMYASAGIPDSYYSNPAVCWDGTTPPEAVGAMGQNNAKALGARAAAVSSFVP